MRAYFLLIICILLGVVGQVLLKEGIQRTGASGLRWETIYLAFREPAVWAGFALYGVAAILWIAVLSVLPLGLAYPALSVGYVAVLGLAWWRLDEPITGGKLVGVLLIVLGFLVLSREMLRG